MRSSAIPVKKRVRAGRYTRTGLSIAQRNHLPMASETAKPTNTAEMDQEDVDLAGVAGVVEEIIGRELTLGEWAGFGFHSRGWVQRRGRG